MNRFANRLRTLRLERNILSKDFAKIMNVAPSTVSRWEKGLSFPDYDTLVKISIYFGCSLDYLLGRPLPIFSDKKYN